MKDGWRKIQWALCKKDDLVKFKADLVGHTESIELLLTTLHMGSTRIGRKSQEENQKSLVRKVQESYFSCMQRLSWIMDSVTTGVGQGKRMLEMTAEVIQTNVQVFNIVLDIQSIITRIPGQVERQQPVYFVDALGRHAPFHLEFVLSAEALTHVLRSNFKNIGSGSQKIERGEFAIQDTCLKRDIDLTGPWEGCFRPGQRVDMSMVFTSKKPSQSCPACRCENSDQFKENQDVECTNCGITFRRTVSIVVDTLLKSQEPLSLPSVTEDLLLLQYFEVGKLKRKRFEDEEEDIALFRRLRIKDLSVGTPFDTLIALPVAITTSSNSTSAVPIEAVAPLHLHYPCLYCGRVFRRPGDRDRHARKHNPNVQRYYCTYLGCRFSGMNGFLRKDKLREHRARHGH